MENYANKKSEMGLLEMPKPEMSNLNVGFIQKSLSEILLELAPGFINNLNNLTSIMVNYRKLKLNGDTYSCDGNLPKIFDKSIESNINLKNYLSSIRQDGEFQVLPSSQLIDKVISLFSNKFSEKNIVCVNNLALNYTFSIPQQLPYYVFVTVLFYLTELTSGNGNISVSAENFETGIEFIFTRKCINPVLKVNSINNIYSKPNPVEELLIRHLANCDSLLKSANLNPVEVLTEKKDISSQFYILKVFFPMDCFNINEGSGKTGHTQNAVSHKKNLATPNILVIDDEKLICDLIFNILEEENYSIDYALDLKDGVDKFNKKQFDLVICDYLLPGATAKDIIDKISETSRKTKIIIITGCEESSIDKSLLKPPVCAILRKPFKIDDIVSLVNDLL